MDDNIKRGCGCGFIHAYGDCRLGEAQLYADAQARIAELEEHVKRLQGALEEIAVGAGPFSRDPLTHAEGCIAAMKSLATAALSPIISAAELTGCENATYCTAERVEDEDE